MVVVVKSRRWSLNHAPDYDGDGVVVRAMRVEMDVKTMIDSAYCYVKSYLSKRSLWCCDCF